MSMKCPYCGSELADQARFCKYCGKPIEKKPEKPKKNVFKVLLLFLLVCGLGAGGWYGWKRYFPHGETGKAETAAENSEESAGEFPEIGNENESRETEAEYHIVSLEEVPEGLDDFLNGFAWAVDRSVAYMNESKSYEYDCSDGRETWILTCLPEITAHFADYPVNVKTNESGHIIIDEKEADWILTNIYNFSADALERAKRKTDDYFQIYLNGEYRWPVGVGGGYGTENIQVSYNGKYYCVIYDSGCIDLSTGKPEIKDPSVSRHYALMEYKMIDGKGYWSIYKDTMYKDAIEGIEKAFPDEKETDITESSDVTDWNTIAEQYYAIYMSYLDFINSKGDTGRLKNIDPEQKARFEDNYYKYNEGNEFTNQVFDFDVTASTLTDKGGGIYEADCYVHAVNSDREIKNGNVTSNDVTIHAKLRYDPADSVWILTYQKGENYSYSGHTMIQCGK